MLNKIGKTVEKKPKLIIITIILITIGFSILLPSINMNTSTEEFMPDNKISKAQEKVTEYFGEKQKILMIYAEKQKANDIINPQALKLEKKILEKLEKTDKTITGTIGIPNFIEIICQIEHGKTLINSSQKEIQQSINDLMTETNQTQIKILNTDDPNEAIDYKPDRLLDKGKEKNCIDIKNYYLQKKNDKIFFTIEVYDLQDYKEKLTKPFEQINVMEWYIRFKNLIIPNEKLNISYQIAAHIEPKHPLWQIGQGPFQNIKTIFQNIQKRELFDTYRQNITLWITPPGQKFGFPVNLKSGNLTLDEEKDKIIIEVEKKELEQYGIAPEQNGFGIPAKLGETQAGFRYYQTPILNKKWRRINLDIDFIQNFISKIQNRPLLNKITTRIMKRYSDFTWENFDQMFSMLEQNNFTINEMSLKDINQWWKTTDTAGQKQISKKHLYIKPQFMDDLKDSVVTFLPEAYKDKKDASKTLMMVTIDGNVSENQLEEISVDLREKINRLDEEENLISMEAAGNGLLTHEINEIAGESNSVIMPLIFIAICILLFITFKKASYTFLPLMGLGISIIWLFGTMVLLGINFNMMYVALVPLMLGLGVDYSVHMFHNYRAELEKGNTVADAIVKSIKEVGTALFLATVTTVIAFLSFLTGSVPPVREFGILSALGIIYTFIITITLQASVRYLLDKDKKIEVKKNQHSFSLRNIMEKVSKIVINHSKTVLIIASILTVVMLLGAVNIQTSFDFEEMLPSDNPTVNVMEKVSKTFPSSSQEQEYILIEGDVATVETLNGIDRTYENMYNDGYIAQRPEGKPKVESILTIVRSAVEKNNSLRERFSLNQRGIPGSDRQVKALFDYLFESSSFRDEVKNVLHQKDDFYDAAVVRIYTSDIPNKASVEEKSKGQVLFEQLTDDVEGLENVEVQVTGSNTMMYVTAKSLTDSQLTSTLICFVLAALVLVVVFRKPVLSAITMIPVTVSICWILGTMYFIGYSVNIMTVMITSLTVGLGVTYAIHAVERFRLIANRTGDVVEAVNETVSHTGGALLAAAVTTVVGFGILVIAPLMPQQQFGTISAITIFYSLVSTLFLLPPVLKFWGSWRLKKKGF
ncbi:MAG: efflux RND transporter permease subunit, partial [Candidatus Thermoplasmatota archaeon]